MESIHLLDNDNDDGLIWYYLDTLPNNENCWTPYPKELQLYIESRWLIWYNNEKNDLWSLIDVSRLNNDDRGIIKLSPKDFHKHYDLQDTNQVNKPILKIDLSGLFSLNVVRQKPDKNGEIYGLKVLMVDRNDTIANSVLHAEQRTRDLLQKHKLDEYTDILLSIGGDMNTLLELDENEMKKEFSKIIPKTFHRTKLINILLQEKKQIQESLCMNDNNYENDDGNDNDGNNTTNVDVLQGENYNYKPIFEDEKQSEKEKEGETETETQLNKKYDLKKPLLWFYLDKDEFGNLFWQQYPSIIQNEIVKLAKSKNNLKKLINKEMVTININQYFDESNNQNYGKIQIHRINGYIQMYEVFETINNTSEHRKVILGEVDQNGNVYSC